MPNRIIKESICTSEDLDTLSPGAEILFYRLIVKADDYGAYYGNEHIVKSTCFPLKPDTAISGPMVKGWLDELEAAGLIIQYAVDGRKYIQLAKWDRHQKIRAKKRKFPEIASKCNQMQSDDCNSPRNPIQSNPIRNPIRIQSESNPDDSDGFEDFWNAYPKKTGDIKQAYFEYVGALEHGATLGDMLSALEWQKQQPEWTGEKARFIPSAEKWLRNRGWTAEKPRGAETGNIFLQMMEDGTT